MELIRCYLDNRLSVLKFFLRLGLKWMLWTRTKTLLYIMRLVMAGRSVWHFFWRMALLCKSIHHLLSYATPFELTLLYSSIYLFTFTFGLRILWPLQHSSKLRWQDAHRCREAEQSARRSKVAREGCLPVTLGDEVACSCLGCYRQKYFIVLSDQLALISLRL